MPFNLQQVQSPFTQYDSGFNQLIQMAPNQASLGYGPPSSPMMNPFGVTGFNQASSDVTYLQWPSASMMYAHSYDQFRHAIFQVFSKCYLLFELCSMKRISTFCFLLMFVEYKLSDVKFLVFCRLHSVNDH